MNTLVVLIKGTIAKIEPDSYTNKAGTKINQKKLTLITTVEGLPYQVICTAPKDFNQEVNEDFEHYYSVYSTNSGFLVVRPL